MEGIYKAVGRQLKALRRAKGLTQEELAEKAHISVIFLSNLETGTKRGYLETYAKLVSALQVEFADLFSTVVIKPANTQHLLSLDHLSAKDRQTVKRLVKSLEAK